MTSLHNLLRPFPQATLLDSATPIQRLGGVERALGLEQQGIALFAKRDDHMALGGGGNKLRKLEFLLGAALRDGVDTVITVGGLQSNHARLTAAACALIGLRCELVLGRAVARSDSDYEHNGNVLLDTLFGASVHITHDGITPGQWAETRRAELASEGSKALVIPTGGSTPLGALGYAKAALEIADQGRQLGVDFKRIVLANGSSGTHAGLAAGFAAMGEDPAVVKSFAVLHEQADTHRQTLTLARETLALLDPALQLDAGSIHVDGSQRGQAYGQPTSAMVAAVRLMARHQGLLIDPVYSGKAFAGLLDDVHNGLYRRGDNLLFLMTGGAPGLFAYRSVFQDD